MGFRKIGVSGVSGFIGSALVRCLLKKNYSVLPFYRFSKAVEFPSAHNFSIFDQVYCPTELKQCSVFIHCAGRAHIPVEISNSSLQEFLKDNTDLTLKLANEAVLNGVKRFIFISSIGVNGAISNNLPFEPDHAANPQTPYAVSKYEAEKGLYEISRKSGLEVVIVRPPLVYGPNAPGNFGKLVRVLKSGYPLPLKGIINNKRSLVSLDNLIDLLITCIDHPLAANQTLLISDGEDLSTSDLIIRLGRAINIPANLFYVPNSILYLSSKLIRREEVYQSLCGSLQVNITKTRQLLDWNPSLTVDEGLKLISNEIY